METKIKPSILFVGWNQNGEKCLQEILKKKYRVIGVFLPASRDVKKMKQICKVHSIPFFSISEKEEESILQFSEKNNPDLMVVASYPKIFSKKILKSFPLGAINVHTAKLPQYRGIHPLNWAIINDEKEIGVTVHFLDAGIDSGNILERKCFPLKNTDTINSIVEKITDLGAEILPIALEKVFSGERGVPQDESIASFAPKRKPEDGKIEWNQNSRKIFNLIRSLEAPYPNAFCFRENGEKIAIKKSIIFEEKGKVIAKIKGKYLISSGDGVLLVRSDHPLNIGEILK